MKKLPRSAPAHLRFAVVASDAVIFMVKGGTLYVRVIPVHRPPHYKNAKAFPGGVLRPEETAEKATHRLIADKGLIDNSHIYLEQLYTFSEVNRDPRGRVVAVAYCAFVPWNALSNKERMDTKEVWWEPAHTLKNLAYDHDEMLRMAIARLRSRVHYTTLISKLMPKEFTLTELEQIYESILEANLDKRNFRKKILKLGILKELPKKKSSGRSRPAKLYSFASPAVSDIEVL